MSTFNYSFKFLAFFRFTFQTGNHAQLSATNNVVYAKLTGIEAEHTFYFDGTGSDFDRGATDEFDRNGPV